MLTLNSILKSLKRLVNEEFECPICLELCSDTHLSLNCGHRFCGKCVRESIRKCNHECPTCRFPIAKHRSFRQDLQFHRVLQRLVTELIEPLDKQMIGQNGTEEVEDLDKGDRRLAPPSHKSAEDFEVPGSTPKEKQKVKPYFQTTKKRKRGDEDEDEAEQQKMPTHPMPVIVSLTPTHVLDKNKDVPLECEMLNHSTPNTMGRSKRLKRVKATSTNEAEQHESRHLLDEDKHLPCEDDKIQSAQHSKKSSSSFNGRFKELAGFKREHGHCRVPQTNLKDEKYHSLGNWVAKLRRSYKESQRGVKPTCNLSEAEIKRLDEIGFEWKSQKVFDKHCTALLKFKEEFGHCHVPPAKFKDAKYHSLGRWVSQTRNLYTAFLRGEKPTCNLSEAEIKRLDEIGFEWESMSRNSEIFENHCTDLLKFKEEFGHCFVPQTKLKDAKYHSLGRWVSHVRNSRKAILRGEKPTCNLSEAKMKRLDEIGFEWESSSRKSQIFDNHCKELLKFKEEFGHCRVPKTNLKDAKYHSLGQWVYRLRSLRKAFLKGEKPTCNLSEAEIKRLEEVGFEWEYTLNSQIFDNNCTALLEFKEEFGHCCVPLTKLKDAKYHSLGIWVAKLRRSYKAILRGEKPERNISEAEMKRLDEIGFEWESTRKSTRKSQIFDNNCTALLEFKEEFGHCSVPQIKLKDAKYYSLGNWVANMRRLYKAFLRGEKLKRNISEAEIKRLDEIGFKWESSRDIKRICSS